MQLLKEVDGESDWFSARKVLPRQKCNCLAMAGNGIGTLFAPFPMSEAYQCPIGLCARRVQPNQSAIKTLFSEGAPF